MPLLVLTSPRSQMSSTVYIDGRTEEEQKSCCFWNCSKFFFVSFRNVFHQRCRILFFPWKRYWATHSLLFEICGIFFSGSGKKNTVQKFQIIQVWASEPWWTPPKWQKNDLMGYIFEKIQIHTMLSDFFVIKMVIEDLLSVFFFPRKLGAGKKEYRDFLSLSPFLRFPS